MLENAAGNPPRTNPGTSGRGAEDDDSVTIVIDDTSDDGSDREGDDRGLVNVGRESNDGPDSTRSDSLPVDFGDVFGDDENDKLPVGDADEHELGVSAISGDYGELDVDLSPWAPLLGMLDSTEPEASPGDRPFTPAEGVEGAHALELRAESMLQYAERGAQRTGELDRIEVGTSDDNRDVVAGRDEVEIDGMLDEHTGHGLVHVADDVEMNVGGPLTMHAHLEDNIIMAGVMRDEFAGGTFITAAMSDDMAAGAGLRCTAPLDVWVHGLVGMEERPGTCAADGILLELAGTLYEREYGPSAHVALVARHSGTVVSTMKTGFRPLMKVAIGVRNLIPGGGGGGGSASASPPAAPPAPGAGDASAATLTAAESGGALGRGAAGGDDTDEIVSVVRTVESASDTTEVEDLQHPASTADNLDDLARVDAEGTGYQQVAEIYEQPIPASAAPEPDAGPVPGTGAAANDRAPPLYRTEPGAEGYDFGQAYGSLHDRNQFYRADSNWRGNIYMREYLSELDAQAAELLTNLGGSTEGIAGDSYGHRTANIYATMQTMLEEAAQTGRLDDVVDIRTAMDRLEALVNTTIVDVAAQSAEFSGAAVGSQRVPIDAGIDTDKLRSWLDEQLLRVQDMFAEAEQLADPVAREKAVQDASWEAAYWVQLIKALDEGINPLADSSEQIALIRVEKVDPYLAQFAGDIADAEQFGYIFIPPRTADQEQLDLFIRLQEQLAETLSDPEFFRSVDEMGGDTVTAAGHPPMDPGPDLPGPDSAHSLGGGVDEPDVGPVRGGDEPTPPPPDDMVADPPPGADSAAPGGATTRREPDPLYSTQPGTDGYDFEDAYGSLQTRNQYYREEFLFRGNFYMREYLKEIDADAWKLFNDLDGPSGAIAGDNFGYETSSIYRTLQTMATEADEAGDAGRAAEIRAAIAKIDGIVAGKLSEVATRVDEFSGVPIDRAVDTGRLRAWLEDQMSHAQEMHTAAETDEAGQRATWEWGYYLTLVQTLDAGGDPLAVSNEQIAALSIYGAGDTASSSVADEVALYISLQDGLLATLADPEFHQSTPALGAPAFTPGASRPIEAGLDILGSDSLRPFAEREVPPPLPAADFADGAVYVDEIRDRSFSRSALAAGEETLQRQVAGLAEGDAAVRSRAPDPGSGVPDPSLGSRPAPPDNAQAPIIDERSGGWVVEHPGEPGGSPAPADSASDSARGDRVSSEASDISWESGLQASGDSEVGSEAGLGAGSADDADASNLFKAPSEPDGVDPEGVDEVQPAPAPDDDGSSGSPGALSDRTEGEDANPTGTVSGPDDSATTPGRGDGTGPGPSGTTSPIAPDMPDPVSTGTGTGAPGNGATPAGASATDSDAGAAGMRSDLYDEPVSFEGRSLEGASRSGDPKELAQPLDGAEAPIEELPRVEPNAPEPARRSILKNSDGRPVSDTYRDLHDRLIQLRLDQAEQNRSWFNRGTDTVDGVWTGGRNRRAAVREANARWSEFVSAQRTSPVSFSDDPRQILYEVEYETTRYSRSRGRNVDLYRGVDPPNTLDRSQAAHYVPRPWDWEPAHETGFGRLAQGPNEFPFSPRERIVNALSKGESLNPEQIAALESGLEGYRAAGGELSSSQYRAMADMISDLGDEYRHARWSMEGEHGERILRLIEMLDHAAVAV